MSRYTGKLTGEYFMRIEKYLGVEVCAVDMAETLMEVEKIIKKKIPSFVVAINPEKIMKAAEDENLKLLLNSAAIKIPDGIGVVVASKLNHGGIKTRVTGIDLMNKICEQASLKGHKIFLLGAKPGVAKKAGEILSEKYNGINIVGVMDGYFKRDDEVVKKVTELSPDILFVALGSPRQENFITSNMEKLKVPLLMGVGGSYDVICGNIDRAPEWMCRLGLEWLFRLIKEPWRYKRMIVLPKFLYRVLAERVKR